jgi:hypothetical protein
MATTQLTAGEIPGEIRVTMVATAAAASAEPAAMRAARVVIVAASARRVRITRSRGGIVPSTHEQLGERDNEGGGKEPG